ncbi:MAG: type III-B CRISPR module RAMP protein Cmr1 [Candidatus Nezhaarchaeota archaeon]|nr:type III-B CRISPR module RAMP protein Cmr1 [Candidatus Nezhaarchaeota archaeon]
MIRRLFIRATALTPISMGGYDQQVEHEVDRRRLLEPPRPTSIRGVWRWWARAIAAGVAFDEGLDEVRAAIEVSNELLGFAGDRGASRSKFQITSVSDSTPRLIDLSRDPRYRNIPRVRLLRGARCTAYDAGYRFSVEVRALSKDEDEVRAGFYTLLCSLMLSGVGKMSRRGFGSLSMSIEGDLDELGEWRKVISNVAKADEQAAMEGVRRAIDMARGAVEPLAPRLERKPESGALPKIPSVAKEPIESMGRLVPAKVYLATWRVDPAESLMCIGNICTRAAFFSSASGERMPSLPCKLLKISHPRDQPEDEYVESNPVCILGLPRSVMGTGYRIVDKDVSRRASPIIFKVLASQRGQTLVLATTLVSSDWPREVEWRRGRRRTRREGEDEPVPVKIDLSEDKIAPVMEGVRRHLGQYGFKEVWP